MVRGRGAGTLRERLRRLEGEVRDLQAQIAAGADCVEVAHKIASVKAALEQARVHLLVEEMRGRLREEAQGAGRRRRPGCLPDV